jgi:hypothetical protein
VAASRGLDGSDVTIANVQNGGDAFHVAIGRVWRRCACWGGFRVGERCGRRNDMFHRLTKRPVLTKIS